ncbi:choice-of-anchor M domain-containing protein [Streptomyces sp. NPDC005435]|uniref:choice-of-anchor M domain-containing protein n=1 Tax=Streptomyces sp. NPDC005435 TaxID=3154464 RepID=UPI00345519A3
MRHPVRLLMAAGVMVGTLIAATPVQAADQVVLSKGHVDVVGVGYEDGELELAVHDESSGDEVEYAPESVRLQALPAARTTVPDDPAYAFLGNAGSKVWILPETQNPDLLWAGFGAEELESGVLQDDTVDAEFLSLQGPGKLAVYTDDVFGSPESVLVDSGDGLPDTVTLHAGDHTHANWAFTAAGTYKIRVKLCGHLASNGQSVHSRTATYTFKVLN